MQHSVREVHYVSVLGVEEFRDPVGSAIFTAESQRVRGVPVRRVHTMSAAKAKQHATVVVLGDFGMSPRMQNHALALAAAGFLVDVVAYRGTAHA